MVDGDDSDDGDVNGSSDGTRGVLVEGRFVTGTLLADAGGMVAPEVTLAVNGF